RCCAPRFRFILKGVQHKYHIGIFQSVYGAERVARYSSMISSTPAPPKPLNAFASRCLPPVWAIHKAYPMRCRTSSGNCRKSLRLDPIQIRGLGDGSLITQTKHSEFPIYGQE